MTTAKPQQANDKSDAADDLIAELAKLMAQDAQEKQSPAERQESAAQPAQNVEPADNTFAFRLPGDAPAEKPSASPGPRFDFTETGKQPEGSAPQAPVTPLYTGPAEPTAEPNADAGTPAVSEPEPVKSRADEHDAIAQLIEADLSAEPQPEARAEQVQSPEPAANVSAPEPTVDDSRRTDAFKVAPVFGLAGPASRIDAAPSRTEPSLEAPRSVAPQTSVAPRTQEPRAPEARPPENADPIDAIETLIGSAVRARIDRPQQGESSATAAPANPAPSPSLRSLATPVLPSQRPQREPAAQAAASPTLSAEDTILAAAAATGANVGWVDHEETAGYAAEDDLPRKAPRRALNLRAFAGPAVAIVALIAAGVGLYTVLGFGGNDGPPPVLTADAAPIKQVPEAQPAADAEPESVVFNEIAGNETPAEDEQIVSRDQSQVAAISGTPPQDATQEGLVNRKVRTVTVRPDGTIVGGEDALAGVAMLPVDRPNVPEVPGAAPADGIAPLPATVPATAAPATTGGAPAIPANGTEPVETAALTPADAPVPNAAGEETSATQAPAAEATTATVPPEAILVPGQPAAVVDAEGNEIAGRTAPVPMAPITRPSAPTGAPTAVATSPVNALVEPASQTPAAAAATQTAAAQPTGQAAPAAQASDRPSTLAELINNWSNNNRQAAPAAAPAQPASTAPAYVQLSSQRTEEAARQTASTLQNRFGSLFGGTPLEVQRVDLGDRGVYYRVRLPTQSLDNATQICNSVKANGGDCFTL